MRKKTILCAALALTALLALGSCGNENSLPEEAAPADAAVMDIAAEDAAPVDPHAAAEAILASYEDRVVEELSGTQLLELTGIDPGDTYGFAAYYSDPDNGLCDMLFISPVDGKRDQLREALYAYKEQRVEQFQNYDILDSLKIAENAVVLDQGDYLVLLMLPDNDTAQEIMDSYLPQ